MSSELKPIWMPLYIGDYHRDTISLSLAQHGAYLLAMMAYWSKGESLEDDELKGVCGSEFKRVSRFFVVCDGRWHHKRIDAELKKASEHLKKIQDNSLKGVQRRRELGQLPKMPVRKSGVNKEWVSQGDLRRARKPIGEDGIL